MESMFYAILVLFIFTFIPPNDACEPGSAKLARWLTRDLTLDSIQQVAIPPTADEAFVSDTKLFYNGSILTMALGNYNKVAALVTQGDEVLFTGGLDEAKQQAGPEAELIDLLGQTLVPGFVEPHLHLILTALANKYLQSLSPMEVNTLDQAKAKIKDATLLNGTWIAGYGYDPSRVEGHPDLTIDITDHIDGVPSGTPIYILNQSGHVAYANSAALAAANVTKDNVKDDPHFQKDKNGDLTGVLFEQATGVVGKTIPQATSEDILKFCNETVWTWISNGSTTVFDAGIGTVTQGTDLALMANLYPVPLRMYGAISNYVLQGDQPPPLFEPRPFQLGQVQVTSIKYWADGSTQGFTAALTEPYLDPPSWIDQVRPLNYNSSRALQNQMDRWLKAGFQMVVHANGDAASDLALCTYSALFAANPNRDKTIWHRIEHFTVTQPDQLVRAAAMGLGVSHTIGHVRYWGDTFQSYVLGDERAAGIDPLFNDTEAGLSWSLHSDSPVTPVDHLGYLRTATTRQLYQCPSKTSADCVLGPDQRVSLELALRAITLSPALQMGIADWVGSLEVGKKADMVVLSNADLSNIGDPSSFDWTSLNVLETWIGGLQVYKAEM